MADCLQDPLHGLEYRQKRLCQLDINNMVFSSNYIVQLDMFGNPLSGTMLQGSKFVLLQLHHVFSVAFCSPAKSLTLSGLMENPLVGKQLKS